MRYVLERSAAPGTAWTQIFVAPSALHPGVMGFVGRHGECLSWRKDGEAQEIWEWSDRVPLNPGDISCTDFVGGWVLVYREASPVPSADELAHFYVQ